MSPEAEDSAWAAGLLREEGRALRPGRALASLGRGSVGKQGLRCIEMACSGAGRSHMVGVWGAGMVTMLGSKKALDPSDEQVQVNRPRYVTITKVRLYRE